MLPLCYVMFYLAFTSCLVLPRGLDEVAICRCGDDLRIRPKPLFSRWNVGSYNRILYRHQSHDTSGTFSGAYIPIPELKYFGAGEKPLILGIKSGLLNIRVPIVIFWPSGL